MTSEPRSPGQTRALARLFVARFFENDITGGSGDLKASFFWLLAFLAPIGILMPWSRSLQYTCYYLVGGSETLSYLALEDKTFYLGLGMVATGIVGVITWPSFLLDRRDVLVLGALPVAGNVIVRAKLMGVLVYGAVLAAGMHAGSSLTFGLLTTDGRSFGFVLRTVAVHFAVACLASMFILLVILASQALLAAISTRTVFARLSPWLQTATASSVLGMLIALPAMSSSLVYADERWRLDVTRRAVRLCAPGMRDQLGVAWTGARPWADLTPVAWFAGLYERLSGANLPSTRALATIAAVTMLGALVVALTAYPLAARRMMRGEVEGTGSSGRAGAGRMVAGWFVRLLARRQSIRAAMQFFWATASRVSSHRFVLALGGGATIGLLLPGALAGLRALHADAATPSVALLSLPLTMMIGAVVTLRVVAALPSELGASWMFRLVDVRADHARSALRRTMWIAAIACPLAACTPLYWMYWGGHLAVVHAALSASVGGLVIEVALWGLAAMPCAEPWTPSQANLRTWWPAYIGAFLFITQVPPRFSLLLEHSRAGATAVFVGLLVLQGLVRWAAGRNVVAIEPDDSLAPQVLHLQ